MWYIDYIEDLKKYCPVIVTPGMENEIIAQGINTYLTEKEAQDACDFQNAATH
jgi:hypothetical protein